MGYCSLKTRSPVEKISRNECGVVGFNLQIVLEILLIEPPGTF